MKHLLVGLCMILAACSILTVGRAEPSRCPYDIHLSIMYNYLSDAEQALYDSLYDALITGRSAVRVPDGVSRERAEWMTDFIYNEAPELCAYDRWASQVVTVSDGLEISLKYKLSIQEQDRFIRETAENADYYAKMGESRGLRAIHDHLCLRFDYGTVDGEDTQLAYYALKNNRALCNGYAQTFVMYAHFAGFTASYTDGSVYDEGGAYAGRHAWNIACENGRFFWLDATWDDRGNTSSDDWYDVSGAAILKTHVPDPEYQPILSLDTILPENVTYTMHLDVNDRNGFSRGITQWSGTGVLIQDLAAGEYYSPAMVIWNNSGRTVTAAVSCSLDGQRSGWNTIAIAPGSNAAFRTNAVQLQNRMGSHEIIWYCGGIRLGVFEWRVE